MIDSGIILFFSFAKTAYNNPQKQAKNNILP
jgi:hypothetical protein